MTRPRALAFAALALLACGGQESAEDAQVQALAPLPQGADGQQPVEAPSTALQVLVPDAFHMTSRPRGPSCLTGSPLLSCPRPSAPLVPRHPPIR